MYMLLVATACGGGGEDIMTTKPEALVALSFLPTAGSVVQGATLALVPTPSVGGAGVTVSYAYQSNAPSVATVNSTTGVVSGVAPGSATITVTATGSGASYTTNQRTASATITVSALGIGFGLEQFASIPTGTYNRGSTNGFSNEQPVRTITISAFRMQKTEVTQAQWRQIMTGTALLNPSGFSGCDACPVEQVSWDDVQQFVSRLNVQDPGKGYRLSTEAEWEYAARATTTGDYGGTGTLLTMGWVFDNAGARTHAVGGKAANLWGLYDMHGNVYEWVSDWLDGGYYATSPATNPQGPASGSSRVLRGGSWGDFANYARSAVRVWGTPSSRDHFIGFRLARTP